MCVCVVCVCVLCVVCCVCGVCRAKVLKSAVDLPRASELNISYNLQRFTQCCLEKYVHASKWPPYYRHIYTHTHAQWYSKHTAVPTHTATDGTHLHTHTHTHANKLPGGI